MTRPTPLLIPVLLLSLLTVATPAHTQKALPTPPSAEKLGRAEKHDEKRSGLSLGFALHRFQDDFGMSGVIGTPTFAGDTLRITAAGGVAWFPHGQSSSGETWVSYGHTRLVIEGGRRLDGVPIRLYGFGGATALIVPKELSSDGFTMGGVGGFGFEFYMPKGGRDGPVSYFIELGGIGTGAHANRQAASPIFANGFLATVGLRVYP